MARAYADHRCVTRASCSLPNHGTLLGSDADTSGGNIVGFAEELRNQSAIDWDAAVNHPFVDQLLDGSLPDERLRQYLVQDYQFCDAFTALLGQAVASAPSLPSRLVFARVLGAFASD